MPTFSSVHLQDFPKDLPITYQAELVQNMDRVRDICSTALAIRDQQNLRVRLPLASILIVGQDVSKLVPFQQLIQEELNVKKVQFDDDLANYAKLVLKINFRQIGERLGNKIPQLMQAVKQEQYSVAADRQTVEIAGETLAGDDFKLDLVALHSATAVATRNNDMLVELDTYVTDQLRYEGITRDVVRLVQQSRKEAQFQVSDRIVLEIFSGNGEILKALRENLDYLKEQTLATSCRLLENEEVAAVATGRHTFYHDYEGSKIQLQLQIAE